MSPPFQFSDFHNVAHKLGQSTDEADLRTAVGRLYYALFHCAKQRLGVSGSQIHKRVIAAVRKKNPATGSQLDALKRLRTAADYDLVPKGQVSRNWQANWSTAQTIASHLLPALQKLRK